MVTPSMLANTRSSLWEMLLAPASTNMVIRPGQMPSAHAAQAPQPAAVAAAPASGASATSEAVAAVTTASIKVLTGAAAGREVPLTKVVTTIGKPAVAVAAITKRHHGYVVHHVEGGGSPTLNGQTITSDPVPLKNGDVIELAGTQMQFVQA